MMWLLRVPDSSGTPAMVEPSSMMRAVLSISYDVLDEAALGEQAERGNVTMEVAFDRLRSHARSNNLRLSELARRVVQDRAPAEQILREKTLHKRPPVEAA